MPEPVTARQPRAARNAMFQGGALGMTCGRFVDVAHSEFAAHKRHDSATWAARTNVKTYTARRDDGPRAGSLADPFAPLAALLPDSRAISRTSSARTRTASASCPAGVLP